MDRKLKWFLVEYDRHERSLRNLTEYAEPEQRDSACVNCIAWKKARPMS